MTQEKPVLFGYKLSYSCRGDAGQSEVNDLVRTASAYGATIRSFTDSLYQDVSINKKSKTPDRAGCRVPSYCTCVDCRLVWRCTRRNVSPLLQRKRTRSSFLDDGEDLCKMCVQCNPITGRGS